MSHPNKEKRLTKAERRAQEEAKARQLLDLHNQQKKKIKDTRRKTAEDMLQIFPQNFLIPSKYIHNPLDWTSKSYNIDRQKMDFANWLYVIYPVPSFMMKLFLTKFKHRYRSNFDQIQTEMMFFRWFLTIAQGGSFAKEASKFLTKKEAHLFLNGPTDNTIKENVWWARCKSVDLNTKLTTFVVKRLCPTVYLDDPFWVAVILFIKREADNIDLEALSDVSDFLRAKHAADKEFSVGKRTFNSLIKLSNEWHREMQLKKFGSENLAWDGMEIPDWKWHDKVMKVDWKVKQLHTSKELFNEGRQMRHCVASYGQRCMQGQSAIFSMFLDDGINRPERKLTIEINSSKQLVQARGRMNKSAEGQTQNVLGKWISANNISHSGYYWW